MMGTSDAVETCFLQLPAAALLCFFQGCSPQNAVVVVDTGTAQLYFFSVHPKAMCRIQCQGTDTEVFCRLVQRLACAFDQNPALVQIRILTIP